MSILINAYCTHCTPPALAFPHELNNRRDRSDPELLEHLNGFVGYVTGQGEREMTQTLYNVARHIQRVRHHLSLNVDENDLEAFSLWAASSNAICFLPDGTVRDPAGLVLVDPDSEEPEEEAEIPYPEDARKRKEQNEGLLQQQGIHVLEGLPPVIGQSEVTFRSARQVAQRCLGLFVAALRAESLASEQDIPVEELRERLPLAMDALSPKELAFMTNAAPARQDILDHTWRYESLFLLQWALGLHDDLPFPNQLCDVPLVARVMLDSDLQQMVSGASLRPVDELLDALDFHFRIHWATRQAELNGEDVPCNLEPGVAAERHYALNWLTQFEEADWDDVDTPT